MYIYDTRIGYSISDSQRRIKLAALVDLFQDGAVADGESVGRGLDYLTERHLAWLMSYWQLEIDEYPMFYDKITVEAIPYEMKGPFGMRDFKIVRDGKVLVKAYSLWTLCDMQQNKPVRVPAEISGAYLMGSAIDMDHGSRKLKIPEGGEKQEAFTVSRHMLDTNFHVNNAQYVVIAQSYIPMDFVPHKMRVEYKSQARLGDVMVPRLIRLEDGWFVSLENQEGAVYAAVEFR